jgi:hypothetical protein
MEAWEHESGRFASPRRLTLKNGYGLAGFNPNLPAYILQTTGLVPGSLFLTINPRSPRSVSRRGIKEQEIIVERRGNWP